MVEFALSLPLIVMLSIGATDLGRAFFYRLPIASAASSGVEFGTLSLTNDIGQAVRSASGAMPNNAATWGTLVNADCTNATQTNQTCGDPGGCTASSSFWTPGSGPAPVACFAVRACTVDDTSGSTTHSGGCTQPTGCSAAYTVWSGGASPGGQVSRPLNGSGNATPPNAACLGALQVVVTYRFVPSTPLISNLFFGPSKALFITSTATQLEEY
ncbi:MAG: pilus assembly protein [Candidatus Dormibacteraeota bacterium]|nr:pilus assembly protein [Candidatus Dormibacteraeota bacterium]